MSKNLYFMKDGKRQYYISRSGVKQSGQLVVCLHCREKFVKEDYCIKLFPKHFCCRKCLSNFNSAAKKNGKWVTCNVCGKETYRTQYSLNLSKTGLFFCSRTCAAIRQKAHPELGVTNYLGQTGLGTHPGRTVATFTYGEAKCEVCGYNRYPELIDAHHIDENSKNHAPENLIWLCRMCHGAVTMKIAHLEDRGLIFDK